MQYLCLGYYAPDAYDRMTADERKALGARCAVHDEKFIATGSVRDVASLEHSVGAHIRPGPNGQTVTDGPFAETRETLGGSYLIDCKDLDQALSLAAKVPSAEVGSIEVRPVAE